VVTQLAKPPPQPKMLEMLRYQAIAWIGIIGGAATLFTNLSVVLNLADWARWLVAHWHEWTSAVWQWCFSVIHIKVLPPWAGLLSFLSFGILIAFSQRMVAAKAQKKTHVGISDEPALPLLRTRTVAAVATILNVPVLITLGERKLSALMFEWFRGQNAIL